MLNLVHSKVTNIYIKSTLLFLCFSFCYSIAYAQGTQVKGHISDESTGLPLSGVTISFDNAKLKTMSDAKGHYSLSSTQMISVINFQAVGYKKLKIDIKPGQNQTVNIKMEPHTQDLSEVSISVAKAPRYKNKDNPAVELIRKVIEQKDNNASNLNEDHYYKEYEKLNISLNMATEKAQKSKILKRLSFLSENSDSVSLPGRTLTPIYMKEKLSQNSVYQSPFKNETTVISEKQSRLDQYIDEDGINEYLDKIYQRVDIYQNDIGLGNQSFMSPISSAAPQFYRYFIVDTIKTASPWQVKLMVSPRNKEDVLFLGYLYISLDGKYAVQKANLSINSKININWVKDLNISLDYQQNDLGRYFLRKSVLSMDLGIFKKGIGLFGDRTIMINDFHTGPMPPLPAATAGITGVKPAPVDWNQLRPEPLSAKELMAYKNIDSLKNSKSFQRTMGFVSLVLSGYVGKGKVEMGPFNSFYSFNPVEGSRIRIGGRTTDSLSKRIYFDGHLAYGTKDQKWKYSLGSTLSLSSESIYSFPVKSLTLRHSFETQIPGQDLNFLEDDNFLLSFKRGVNDKWLYNRKWLLEYLHETKSHFSFKFSYKNQQLNPAGGLNFTTASLTDPININSLNTSEFSTEIRWAPHEQFYFGKRFRRPIKNQYPIFTLRASVGLKDFLKGDYNYQNFTLNIFKRTHFSQLGFSDIILEGGAVLGKVPFPLLVIHRANQTYAYQLPSYNLMNFMEFMSDKYVSLNLEHSFNGFFLNKVPLIKKLQLRELVTVKVLQGSLSSKNDPGQQPELYEFPKNRDGKAVSFGLGNTPYIEGSLGVSNILKFLRIDFVRRFTYLQNPGIAKSGIRFKVKVDF